MQAQKKVIYMHCIFSVHMSDTSSVVFIAHDLYLCKLYTACWYVCHVELICNVCMATCAATGTCGDDAATTDGAEKDPA